MQRIKIIRDHQNYKAGQVIVETNNVAFGLLDAGYAVLSKDMVNDTDYKVKALRRAKNKRGKGNGQSS